MRTKSASLDWSVWKRMLNEDDYNTFFTSVSNGKATVNRAVTDMGVYTPPDATFDTTAANVRKLSSAQSGNGRSYTIGDKCYFAITGLPFILRAVFIHFDQFEGNIVYNTNWSHQARTYSVNRGIPAPSGWQSWSTDTTRSGNDITFIVGNGNHVTNFRFDAIK
ncbi:hypothetical protein [Solibacillus cecembensis]|uniref:hypothetical protein n=1 Tax=Solibacillus cecembensis TaxID=459347 RepID=UPI003D01C518